MSLGNIIAKIRAEKGLTQEQMARDLFVTRQAVSRRETGETSPGVDMVKLICVTYSIPLERFFEMPLDYYCQCCSMPIPDEALHGTEADGSKSDTTVNGAIKMATLLLRELIWTNLLRQLHKWRPTHSVFHVRKPYHSWRRCSPILNGGKMNPPMGQLATQPTSPLMSQAMRLKITLTINQRIKQQLLPTIQKIALALASSNGTISKGSKSDSTLKRSSSSRALFSAPKRSSAFTTAGILKRLASLS